ncbi:MAG: PCRF domain-containing protein, partial [Bacteroidales bacterium]|nr:PCRF domain-containing protein [Bacteroidales bacterium]
MLEKLEAICARYQDIEQQMNDPQVTADMKRYVKLSKDYKDLQPIVEATQKYKRLLDDIAGSKELLASEKDEELRDLAKIELNESTEAKDKLEEEIRIMLIPKDPQDAKNAIVEIRAGTGGDEACIFAGDLFRMYSRFCEKRKLKCEIVSFNEGTAGGYKDITFNVIGDNAYGTLKYESGVHRVQRVPATETQGRIHTSAAAVVVLPEAEEVDVELNMNDIRKET